MVCVNHFSSNSLNSASENKPIQLERNAVPTIFISKDLNDKKVLDERDACLEICNGPHSADLRIESIDSNHSNHSNEETPVTTADLNCPNESCTHCEHMQFEYNRVRKNFSDSTIQYDLKLAKLQEQNRKLQLNLSNQSKHVKSLIKNLNYSKKSKEMLKRTINDLRNENLICNEAVETLKKINEDQVLSCLIKGIKSGEKYPEDVRRFCFNVSYHSPAAYEIMRTQFKNHLPHTRTIKAWYQQSDISGEPGIHQETLNRLKLIVSEMDEPLICALIFDEMYIRTQVQYDQHKMKYVGYVSYPERPIPIREVDPLGDVTVSQDIPEARIAKQAIVFMLSGLNKHFKFPVAYHFIDQKIDSDDRVNLLTEVIDKVSECGVNISNLTFDGLRANFTMCQKLGANLDITSPEFKPFFENPFNQSKIHIVVDPCHMEKLLRNTLGRRYVLYDDNDAEIKWSHFEELEKLSRENNLFNHKLSKKHMEWRHNIMNVRIAVETFSESVGNAMQILKQEGHRLFVDAEPTIRFTYMADKLFNIFNTTLIRNGNNFKSALNDNNRQVIFQFLDFCSTYLKSLQVMKTVVRNGSQKRVKTRVIDTQYNTGFKGIIINIASLKAMFLEYVVEKSIMKSIPTYNFSQDHVELFFSKIRARNGHNDNPNVLQFQGAYRRLQCNLHLKIPENSNCQMFEPFEANERNWSNHSNIYFVSSRRPTLDIMNDNEFQRKLASQHDTALQKLAELEEFEKREHLVDGLSGASIAYAARSIEEKIETKDFYCNDCKFVFRENDKLIECTFHIIESKRPCHSTFIICKIVDRFLNLYHMHGRYSMKNLNAEEFDFNVLYYMIFQEIDFDRMYENTDFSHHIAHKFHMIKCIVREYITMKTRLISKRITFGEYNKFLRSKLTNWIQFCGQ